VWPQLDLVLMNYRSLPLTATQKDLQDSKTLHGHLSSTDARVGRERDGNRSEGDEGEGQETEVVVGVPRGVCWHKTSQKW
jgi:hypothetical protein